MSRSISGNHPGCIGNRLHCERCGKRGPQLAERIDANLRVVTELLCTPCCRKTGFQHVRFDRSQARSWGAFEA